MYTPQRDIFLRNKIPIRVFELRDSDVFYLNSIIQGSYGKRRRFPFTGSNEHSYGLSQLIFPGYCMRKNTVIPVARKNKVSTLLIYSGYQRCRGRIPVIYFFNSSHGLRVRRQKVGIFLNGTYDTFLNSLLI